MNRVPQHPVLAFTTALAAVAVLSLMDAVMKGLVIALGIYAVSLWRAIVSAGFGAVLYLPRRKGWPDAATLRIHVFRGAIITVMGVTFFWGLARTPMAQAIALTFIAPLIALFLSVLVLGEKLGRAVVGGSLFAFAGVLVILLGQAQAELGRDALLGSAAILFSAVCYAVNIVLMRKQALAARPPEITFFQNLTVAALIIAALPLLGPVAWPSGHELAIVAAAGMSTAGLLLFAFAYARGEASYLSVTEYSGFAWAAIFGWLFFEEGVSLTTLAGAAMIVGGCVIAARGGRRDPIEPEIEAVA
ncbi:MAG TPA: DMT family transporter [Sphingomicrobium sp.]|nr:DMT family transporter [Sphingomicrobium sp.]